jgi:ParB family chromosome partitioning protein
MKKRALGKGLNALIPKVEDIIEDETKRAVQEIPVDRVQPNPYQPRHQFNSQTIQQMAESIKTKGLLQPIVVRRVDDRYQLVSGERRLRAARVAELERIPALIKGSLVCGKHAAASFFASRDAKGSGGGKANARTCPCNPLP